MSEPYLIDLDKEMGGEIGTLSIREKIKNLEMKILAMPQHHVEPVHRFAHGLYAREVTLPKNMILTGMIHKFEHLNIISKGKILVLTEDGPKIAEAPCTLVSRPGTKRVGYVIEECVWTTIHALPSNEKDIKKVEELLVCNNHEELKLTEKEINLLKEAECLL